MKSTLDQISKQYASALDSHLKGGGEMTLKSAYEIGRKALEGGLGLVDMAAIHQQALRGIPSSAADPDTAAQMPASAEKFFIESLTPFEMALRGYREANEALRASEQRYRELFENANDIVFTTDLDGNFVSVNKACERLTGYQRDQTPTLNFADIVAPEFTELAERMRGSKLGGKMTTTTYELEILTKDGRRIPLDISTRLVLRDGKPVGFQGIGRETTERRRAQEALRQLNSALEEQAKRIAHALHDEAGQLLATVHIELEEVARDVPPEGRKQFETIRDTLYEIEDQLRQFSHELRPTVLDDLGLKAGLEFLAKNVSRRTGIAISLENTFERRLPSAVETALYRITQEALTNITKHAQAKNVVLQLRDDGQKVYYSIRDDGVGFDAVSVLSKRGERGLGLLGIQMRLDAFGGSFSISSVPEKGSELLMTIPLGR